MLVGGFLEFPHDLNISLRKLLDRSVVSRVFRYPARRSIHAGLIGKRRNLNLSSSILSSLPIKQMQDHLGTRWETLGVAAPD